MRILGIETSCDECAAAVVEDGRRILSDVVSSQVDLHAPFGGVVPEIASRRHLETVIPVVDEALSRAGVALEDMDALAVTNRPGLIGALLVGLSAAKGLSLAVGKPLIPVHHIHAHIHAALMEAPSQPRWPVAALVVSGGHTSLYRVDSHLTHERVGATQDDAAGEAFDKVASILGLGYPGGPAIQKAAGDRPGDRPVFPRSFPGGEGLDFSFSGLKTAVLYHCRGVPVKPGGRKRLPPDFDPEDPEQVGRVAAAFQAAVVDVLVKRTLEAARIMNARAVAVGGGVAANRRLRERLTEAVREAGLELYLTPPARATDNAVMVAALAWHLARERLDDPEGPWDPEGFADGLEADAHPR